MFRDAAPLFLTHLNVRRITRGGGGREAPLSSIGVLENIALLRYR